jgi:DNA-directed RNA polymerase specialized sigma24 family protein
MDRDTATKFLDELTNNPQLRAEFREDPEAALIRSGLELNEHDRKTLASMDWGQVPDQELAQRMSKSFSWSDARLKRGVETLQGSLARLQALRVS